MSDEKVSGCKVNVSLSLNRKKSFELKEHVFLLNSDLQRFQQCVQKISRLRRNYKSIHIAVEIRPTLISEISECRCECAATCSRPERTPLESSQSSPLQQVSVTSITALRVFVSLVRSPCTSSKGVILKNQMDCESEGVDESVREEWVEGGCEKEAVRLGKLT